jgi:hypothetical protein
MKNSYELKTIELQEGTTEILEMTDTNGVISCVPMVAGNSDYEAYLNPVEDSTEKIPPA